VANLADLDDFEMDVVSVLSPPLLTQTRQLATKAVPSAANPQENGDDDGAELVAASVLPRESVKVLGMVNAIEQRLQMPQSPHLRSTKTKPVPQADLKLADGSIEKLDDGGVTNDCLGATTGKVYVLARTLLFAATSLGHGCHSTPTPATRMVVVLLWRKRLVHSWL